MSLDPLLAKMAEEEKKQQQLKQSMSFAVTVDPNQRALDQRIAADLGVAPDAVEEDRQAMDNARRINGFDFDGFIKGVPSTAAWMSNPENAAVAHDDMDTLAELEKVYGGQRDDSRPGFTFFPNGMAIRHFDKSVWMPSLGAWVNKDKSGAFQAVGGDLIRGNYANPVDQEKALLYNLKGAPEDTLSAIKGGAFQGFYNVLGGMFSLAKGAIKAGVDKADRNYANQRAAEGKMTLTPLSELRRQTGDDLDLKMLESLDKVIKWTDDRKAFYAYKPATFVEAGQEFASGNVGDGFSKGVRAAAGAFGGIVPYLLPGNAGLKMYVDASGRRTRAQMDRGDDAAKSLAISLGAALPDAIIGNAGHGVIPTAPSAVKDLLLKPATTGFAFFAKHYGDAVVDEALGISPIADPNETLGEWAIRHFKEGGLESFVSGYFLTAVPSLLPAARQEWQNRKNEQLFKAMGDTAQQSKLMQRLPDAYKNWFQNLVKDGPIQSVFVNRDALDTLYQSQGLKPNEIKAEMERLGVKGYGERISATDKVEIPIDVFATEFAKNPDVMNAIQDHYTFHQDGLTRTETAEARKQFGEELKAMGDREAKKSEEFKSSPEWQQAKASLQAEYEKRTIPEVADTLAIAHANAYAYMARESRMSIPEVQALFPFLVSLETAPPEGSVWAFRNSEAFAEVKAERDPSLIVEGNQDATTAAYLQQHWSELPRDLQQYWGAPPTEEAVNNARRHIANTEAGSTLEQGDPNGRLHPSEAGKLQGDSGSGGSLQEGGYSSDGRQAGGRHRGDSVEPIPDPNGFKAAEEADLRYAEPRDGQLDGDFSDRGGVRIEAWPGSRNIYIKPEGLTDAKASHPDAPVVSLEVSPSGEAVTIKTILGDFSGWGASATQLLRDGLREVVKTWPDLKWVYGDLYGGEAIHSWRARFPSTRFGEPVALDEPTRVGDLFPHSPNPDEIITHYTPVISSVSDILNGARVPNEVHNARMKDLGYKARFPEGDVLYQSAASPKLSALHNLTADNLAFADKIGGLAVPSIAVVKDGMGMSGFGDITMIGGKRLADPASNPVFDADAYAPRFPKPEYGKAKSSVVQKLYDFLKPLAKEFDDQRALTILWDYSVNSPDPSEIIRTFADSNMAKAAFLREKGETVEPVKKPARVEAPFLDTESWRKFQAETGWDRNYDVNDSAYVEKLSRAISEGIDEWVSSHKTLDKKDAEYLAEVNKKNWLGEDGKFKINREYTLTRSLEAVGRMDVESYETRDMLNENLKGRESEFKSWIDNKVLSLFGAPSLKSGRSKVPYTLDNIVEAMTGAVKNQEKGMTFGEGAARAAMSKQFKDLERMRSEAGTSMASEAEVEAAREVAKKLTEQYRTAVIEQFKGLNWKGEIDTWEALDASMKALAKMARKRTPSDADIRTALRSENFNVSNLTPETIALAKDAVAAFRTAPVPYFESKPQRAVGLGEFSGAVIPESATHETRAILDKNGIPYREYAEGKQEEVTNAFRSELAKESTDVLFQRKDPLGDLKRLYQSYKDDMSFGSKGWQEFYGLERGSNRGSGDRGARAKRALREALTDKGQAEFDRLRMEAEQSDFAAFEKALNEVVYGDGGGNTSPRGWFRIRPDGVYEIGTTKIADLSTFIHEPAHGYLFMLGDLSKRAGASEVLKSDYAKILDFLGAKDGEPLTVEQHEQWARANEQYFREGKAPTKGLAGVFQRIATWMQSIYKRANDLGVELSPEIREVMDRLYAGEEAVNKAEADFGSTPMFKTSEEAGWTEAQFQRYSEDRQISLEEAKAEVVRKLNEAAIQEKSDQWQAEERITRKAVQDQLEASPVYQAIKSLRQGFMEIPQEDGTKARVGLTLSKEALVEQFGDERVRELQRKHPNLYRKEGGMDPETVAETLGFGSADEMLKALEGTERKSAAVEQITRQTMTEKYGDIRYDGTMEDQARLAVANDGRAKALHQELEALKKKMDLSADEKGYQKTAIKQMLRSLPPLQLFREEATRQVEAKQIIDLNPNAHLNLSRKSAREAFEKAAKGDIAGAYEAKQKELLNHFMFSESMKGRDEADAGLKYASRFDRDSTRQRLMPEEIGPDGKRFKDTTYIDQIDQILEQFQFKKATNKAVRQSLIEFMAEQMAGGEMSAIDPQILASRPKNYKELTLPELRAVKDSLRNIETIAKRQAGFMAQGKRVAFADAMSELAMSPRTHIESKPLPVDDNAKSLMDRIVSSVKKVNTELLRFEEIVDRLDNGDINGPWRRYVFEPLCEAQYKEHELNLKVTNLLADAMEAMPKAQRHSMSQKYEIKGIGTVTRKYILSMALNMGNESNQTKMLKGMGWADKPEAVADALSKLNRSDWEFVQKTWDAIDTLWPEIAALEERMTGSAPVRVERRAFEATLADGSRVGLSGGYYPIVFDPMRSTAGAAQNDVEIMKGEGGWNGPVTAKGHTKERVEAAAYPMLMDFEQVLIKHTARVIKDVSHREAALAVSKLLRNQEVRLAVQETLGPEYEAMMMPWLKGTVNDAAVVNPEIGDWMLKARSNMVISSLAFRVSSVVVQATDLIRVMAGTNRVSMGSMVGALGEMATSPIDTVRFVRSKSKEMAGRAQNLDRDVRAAMRRQFGKDGLYTDAQKAGMKGLEIADAITSHTAWLAAFRQATSEGAPEAEAIAKADRVVRTKLMSGAPKDLTALMRRDAGAWKLVTTYMGDAVSVYGMLSRAAHDLPQGKNVGTHLFALAVMNLVAPIIGDYLKHRGPQDDEDKRIWAAKKAMFAMPSSVPILRDIVQSWETGRDYSFTPLAGVVNKALVKPVKMATSDKEHDWSDWFGTAFDATGSVAGIPGTSQAMTTGRYLKDVKTGKKTPDGPVDHGLNIVFGPKPDKKGAH